MFPLLYFCMYRTNVGLKLMDTLAKKYPRLLNFLGVFGIYIGFFGMAVVSVEILWNVISLITNPATTAGVSLVLPIKAKGIFYVPLLYWIVSLAVIVTIHEFAHGVIARLHKIKVKSSGLAFLGVLIPIIPAAFVEPDEKQLRKKPIKQQLAVFAAGPLANILLAFMILPVLLFVTTPLASQYYDFTGVEITGLSDGYAVADSGIAIGEVITKLGDTEIKTIEEFKDVLTQKKPGEDITITTEKETYTTTVGGNPSNKEEGYLGVFITQVKVRKDDSLWVSPLIWFNELLFWLFALNLGVGLFNLLPLGPVDGGRMFDVALKRFLHEDHAKHVWHAVSGLFLLVVLSTVVMGFL